MTVFKKLKKPKFGYKILNDNEILDGLKLLYFENNERKRLIKKRRKKDKNAGRK